MTKKKSNNVIELDEAWIREPLDACILTDEEIAQGIDVWATYPDVIPEW